MDYIQDEDFKNYLANSIRGRKKFIVMTLKTNGGVVYTGQAIELGSSIAGTRELLHALGGSTVLNEDKNP